MRFQWNSQNTVALLKKRKRFLMIHYMWISMTLTIPLENTALSCWVNRLKGILHAVMILAFYIPESTMYKSFVDVGIPKT
jgi:hypothetical protein